MIFSTKPYDLDACLLADDTLSVGALDHPEETPLEYHINHYFQSCRACARQNEWSELTLLSFHRSRKTRTIRAVPNLEYNLPLHTHSHDPIEIAVCAACAPLAQFALRHLPSVAPARERVVPLGWRDGPKPPAPPKTKSVVTDDDLLA